MVITAKYNGKCRKCGGKIKAGEKIEWERERGASHVSCPAVPEPAVIKPREMRSYFDSRCSKCGYRIRKGEKIFYSKDEGAYHIDCDAAQQQEKEQAEKRAAEIKAEAPWSLHSGSGYGGREFSVGDVLRAPEHIREKDGPQYLFVVRAKKEYVAEDGMSFGVGDESGYLYSANCREATAEEAAPLVEREKAAAEKKAAEKELDELKKEIQEIGEKPEGVNSADGKRVLDTQNIYGGGDWFVIGTDYIWYVQNNGADGDNWSINNVGTGGAGAIGWRIPFSADKAARLLELAVIVEK